MAVKDFNWLPCDNKSAFWTLFTTKFYILGLTHYKWYLCFEKDNGTVWCWIEEPRFLNSRIPPYLYWAQAVEGKKTHILFLTHIPTQGQWRLSETQELRLKFSILSRDHPHQNKIKLKLGHSLSPSVPVKSLPKGSNDRHMIQGALSPARSRNSQSSSFLPSQHKAEALGSCDWWQNKNAEALLLIYTPVTK